MVKGSKRHLIYDLSRDRGGGLFHLEKSDYNIIKSVLAKNSDSSFTKEEEEAKDILLSNNLIEEAKKQKRLKSIKSIRENIKPSFAWIEITQQCNLKCVFCYEESDCYVKKQMVMEDFQKAKKFLIDNGIKKIQFIGGEPMLHPQLKDMIRDCHENFDFIEVYTNATFITQEWCDFFKEYKINVAASFHSYIEEEFEKITQVKGSFTLAKRGVELMVKNELPLRIAAIENKNVIVGEKPKDIEFTFRIQPPRLVGRGKINQFNLEMFKKIVITKEHFRKPVTKGQVVKAASGHQCFNRDIYVAYNLEVFPCVMERRVSHGFITGEDDSGLIKKNICEFNKDIVEECKKCEFRYVCYDCRPNCNGGDLMTKPWNCSYNPKTGEWEDTEAMFERLVDAN
ncbi:MAG: radical SAM protein [Rickettsiales bacterium]|nr:radical SAM protein [Rickettsiales bacterium]